MDSVRAQQSHTWRPEIRRAAPAERRHNSCQVITLQRTRRSTSRTQRSTAYQFSIRSGRRASTSTQNPHSLAWAASTLRIKLVRSQLFSDAWQFRLLEHFFEIAIAAQAPTRLPTENQTRSAWPRTACRPASYRLRCGRLGLSSAAPAPAIRTPAVSAVSIPSNPSSRTSSAT